ncbi:NADPH-dependent FMN reductase [Thermobifida cellulosilytica]|uniref:NADPH-dependent FMN reductase-like domain-containing protein n=1 Tax=Thermobifida cellulosilytica TB100 TaxID=665004 RepID=A0A147KKK0_THECS|nr:NAD(P)H-dependent oxidoreductase [Thermobifida cellulosilytica]KUP97855.1 hypothetical protein AC529_04615 [Thermobifida cellulosilytica TB100]
MLVVGIGGTVSPASSSDRALRTALEEAARLGAETRMFSGDCLKRLPMYDPTTTVRSPWARELVEALRECSGVVLSSAAYHGSVPGMLKNALDYAEDLAGDDRTYLSGRPVGCIAVARGWQAGVQTLSTLRTIVHALRGWPTPYGCVVNTADSAAGCGVAAAREGLCTVAGEVVYAARVFSHRERSGTAAG